VGGKIRNEHTKMSIPTFFFFFFPTTTTSTHTHNNGHYMVPSSLFDCFFCVCVLSACVMPSSQSQTNRCQGAPYISDGVERLFTFFSSCCLAHRRIHPRGEQRGVPIRPSPKLINLFFFSYNS
jgi:hypothetical protein